ncbi:tail tape measure protein TP901 core region [Nitrosomonas sp. Is79A3]|uniref:hypothetical protein n=1 Tax=Nitrosomonas sp. (strain Is79A3) TaxID=261292 RepID=UPI000215CA1E
MSALGSLVVKLALDHAEYTQGLDRSSQEALKFAQNSQKSFDQAEQSAKEFFGNVAAGAVGVVTSIVGIDAVITRTKQNIDILASLDDAAQKTGSSVEDLSRIQKTAKNFGDDFGAIEQSISRLAKGLGSFDDEGNQAMRALDAIGVSARDSNGELRTAADVYIDVARSLQEYKDNTQKTAVAQALFGKSGADQLPILNNLARGIDDVTASSAGSAQQADEFNDALARSNAAVDSIFEQLAQNLLPTLLDIAAATNLSSGSFGEFSTTSSVVATILKGIAIAGRATVDVINEVGRQIGGTAAQLVALANLDFKGAFFIGEERGKDLVRATDDFNQFVDTVLNGDKKLAAATTDGGLKKTIDFALNMPAAQREATQSTRQAIDASQAFMDKLQQEADQLGKTSVEIRKMQAAKLGLSDAADPLIDQIESETTAAKLLESQLSRVKSITEQNMTADERFAQTVDELNTLLNLPVGGLGIDSYNRALKKAQEELGNTGQSAQKMADDTNQYAVQAARNIQTSMANFLFDPFDDGLKGMISGVANAVRRMGAEFAAMKIANALGLSQIFGGVGGTGALLSAPAAASGGSSLLSNVGSGAGIMSLLKGGASGITSGISGMMSGGGLGAFALPMLGAFALNTMSNAFAGDKTLGNGFTDFMQKIPILGAGWDIVAGLFGRGPMKQQGTSLTGEIGASGFESGSLSTRFKAKGGLFRSDKIDFANIDAVTGAVSTDNGKLAGFANDLAKVAKDTFSLINETTQQTSSSLRQVADDLGISSDSIDNFSYSISILSDKGKMLTDEQIAGEITKISDSLARGLVPQVDDLAKRGESALQTVTRLGTEFNALSDAATILGKSVAESRAFISGASFEGRTGFVDAAGGIDALNQKAAFFAQNFLTDAERLAPVQEKLNDELHKLNLSADLTRDQFKGLVQSFGKVNGVSEETLQSLLSLAPAFIEVRNAQDQLAQSSESAAQAAINASREIVARNADDTEYGQRLNKSIQETTSAISELDNIANQLLGTVNSINLMSVDTARRIVSNGDPYDPNLQAALSVLSGMGTGGFSTSLDYQRAKGANVAAITDLQNVIAADIYAKNSELDQFNFEKAMLQTGLANASSLYSASIPRFATGASFVPKTGLSIVERGERIFNTEQNQDLIGAIKQLVREVEKGTVSSDSLRSLLRDAMEETDSGLAMRQKAVAA